MYVAKVIVYDVKTYSVVQIRHSRCLHTIHEGVVSLTNNVLFT